jgi:uncharacterized protein (TIGR04222 family)
LQNLPFLDLPGPEFLNAFGAVVIVVLALTALVIHFADRTDPTPPPVPEHPDSMEVAFLQGGVNQVIRTVVYDLVQRGFATLATDDRVEPTGKTPQPGELDAVEGYVLALLASKPKAHELFGNRAQRKALLALLEPVRQRLAAQDHVKPDSVKNWRHRMQIFGGLVLLGFAGAKVYVALSSGNADVSYLVFLCGASILSLLALAYVMTRSHASRRGRAWLEAMQLAYRSRLDAAVSQLGAGPAPAKAFEGSSLFLIGLYGFAPLRGTSEGAFARHFRRASIESGGSCGSSCGGSCGDGSA